MCDNVVYQYVPCGYDYREVKSKCGTTGIHGEWLICDKCAERQDILDARANRMEDIDADNAALRSAGWGEM